jgi:hypothetical protein
MSKPAKITILCEDLQQACFVRRFLMNRGWTRHDLYESIAPAGSGSGEQWVRERLPREMKAYRSKCNHLRNGLVAVIDADSLEVVDRVRGFETACDQQGVASKQSDERVLYVIPKRNIETWLAYLRGAPSVDEQTQYPRYEYQSLCHPEVDRLDAMCQNGQLEGQAPASLQRCCQDFQGFWRLIR